LIKRFKYIYLIEEKCGKKYLISDMSQFCEDRELEKWILRNMYRVNTKKSGTKI
jgi:hypothetical protein